MKKERSCNVRVVHKVSHRTRLKVDKKHRQPENLHRMKRQVEKAEGVQHVEVNERTGSLIVHHHEGAHIPGHLNNAISELVCECVEVAIECVEPELGPLAMIISKLLPVAEKANPNIDKLILPVGLIALGFVGGFHAKVVIAKLPKLLPFV